MSVALRCLFPPFKTQTHPCKYVPWKENNGDGLNNSVFYISEKWKKIAFPPGVGSPLVLGASYLNIVRSCFCAPKLKCMFNCCNCNLFSNGIITRRDEERLCIILLFSFSIFVLTFCLNLGWSLGRETVQLLWDKEMTLPAACLSCWGVSQDYGSGSRSNMA